jgi:hypothetical protein
MSDAQLSNLAAEQFNGIALFGSVDLVVKTNENGTQGVTATELIQDTNTCHHQPQHDQQYV